MLKSIVRLILVGENDEKSRQVNKKEYIPVGREGIEWGIG